MTTSPRRRAWIFGLFALWLLEWVFAFSAALGRPGELLGLLWWIALAYFVIESRTGRMPRWLHTWLWLGAVLGIAVLRAWVIGDEGLLIFHAFAEMAGEPERLGALVASGEWIAADALVTAMLLGMLIGIAGLCESLVIMGMSWVGDLLGSRREAARVGIVPRMVVWALQAPIFGGLMGCSLAIIAAVIFLRQAGRQVEGLALLVLMPGCFYVAYQNFGNDPPDPATCASHSRDAKGDCSA